MEPTDDEKPLIDTATPNQARIYDFLLGGKDNFAADRDAAKALLDPERGDPGLRTLARENRDFIVKTARWAASMLCISQHIDLGCGLPAVPSVEAEVRAVEPDARIVYVDNDPVVLSHVSALQAKKGVAVVRADLTDPEKVLACPALLEVIDMRKPVCVILGAVLHYLDSDKARRVVSGYAARLAAGSAVIISCAWFKDKGLAERLAGLYTPGDLHNHDAATVASWFDAADLRLMRGRVADVRSWPLLAKEPERAALVLGGIGIKDEPQPIRVHRFPS
jgi:S-adenosyl methyltransferase